MPPTAEPPLLLVDASVAYGGRAGTCYGGAALQSTSNGGVDWSDIHVPANAVLLMRSLGANQLTVVGADNKCRVREWTSSDGGTTWGDPTNVSDLFVRDPQTPRDVLTPTGVTSSPCPDRDVAPIAVETISDVDGAVMCDDGVIYLTGNGGAKWSDVTPVDGAEAMAFHSPDLGWVLQRNSGICAGYRLLRTVDGGTTWNPGGCVGEQPTADQHTLPALSFANTQLGMATWGGATYATKDAGYHWHIVR
jgi:photosystem II stability/assembly factor-like uncharacterized protein